MQKVNGYKNVDFGIKSTILQNQEDGSLLYTLHDTLKRYPRHITEKLDHFSTIKPNQIFIARKSEDKAWITYTYAETLQKVKNIASYLLQFSWKKDNTIVILSENSIEHALIALAALYLGIPYSPISPAYSLAAKDLSKLKHCLSVLSPKIVFAQHSNKYKNALNYIESHFSDVEIITADGKQYKSIDALYSYPYSSRVDDIHNQISSDSIAKILFTSGSTGNPKGVINTHGMWCANLQQITQAMPFMMEKAPVLVDWLPWNHTFGGNHNFGLTVYHGGTLYIDDGKSTSQGIETTVQNLKEIAPSVYFNVPKGFEMLIPYLEQDDELRSNFFSNLNMLFYAGAGLSQSVWDKLEELSIKTIGVKIPIISGLGCTESGPSAMFANWPGAYSGLLGIPVAGLTVKLINEGDKLEARYKGPNVTLGYWRNEEATKNAFDKDGFYKTGDAVKFVSDNPDDGLVFDGRIAEDFKLSTGTWVNVGVLKAAVIASGAPIIQDAVLTGLNKDFVGAILFLNQKACIDFAGLDNSVSWEQLSQHEKVISYLDEWLLLFNKKSTGSATSIKKYIVATFPPSLEKGEITEKGSLNQQAVLNHRAELITKMYE